MIGYKCSSANHGCQGNMLHHHSNISSPQTQLYHNMNNDNNNNNDDNNNNDMGQVMKLWLPCYLVLLSIDSKTR